MASVTTRLRNRLGRLCKFLSNDEEMDKDLQEDTVVSQKFLEKHNILLIPHQFDSTDSESTNLSYRPPILFVPRPLSIFTRHPIDPDQLQPKDRELAFEFPDYDPPAGLENIYHSQWNPMACATDISMYLEKWAFGGFPRKLPPGFTSFEGLFGINRVSYPHPLLKGAGLAHVTFPSHKGWDSCVWEYDPRGSTTIYPHVVLLTRLSSMGHEDTITLGELSSIVKVMEGRAHQPVKFKELGESDEEESDLEEEQEDNPELLFKYEQRFPVCNSLHELSSSECLPNAGLASRF